MAAMWCPHPRRTRLGLIVEAHQPPHISLQEFKRALREQFYMLLIDRQAALQAIPKLLPGNSDVRREAMEVLRHVIAAQGPEDSEVQKRVQEIETLFGLRQDASGTLVPFAPARGAKRP